MMNTLLRCVILAALICLALSLPALAQTEGDYTYEAVDGGVCITGCRATDETLVVPETLGGKPVVSIGYSAFREATSKNVTLPVSLRTVGYDAFGGNWTIQRITFTGDVDSIGEYAFLRHPRLETVTFRGNVGHIGDYAFRECHRLQRVTFEKGLTSIGRQAFSSDDALTDIKLPEGFQSLDMGVFINCTALSSVTLPASLQSMGSAVFRDCTSLTRLTLPEGLTAIGGTAFAGCTSLKDVRLPASLTAIGAGAFFNDGGIRSVDIPDTVTHIGYAAFPPCTVMVVGQNTAAHRYAVDLPRQSYRVRDGDEARSGEACATVAEKVAQIVQEVVTGDMDAWETLLAFHDYLCEIADYDDSHKYYEASGVLLYGKGVCESYTEALSLLLDAVGITNDAPISLESVEGHTWNLVCLDGKWYNVDVTWDDGKWDGLEEKGYTHNFFCVPDRFLEGVNDHKPVALLHPATDYSQYFYYRRGYMDAAIDRLVQGTVDGLGQGQRRFAVTLSRGDFPFSSGYIENVLRIAGMAAADREYTLNGAPCRVEYTPPEDVEAYAKLDYDITVQVLDTAPRFDGGNLYASEGDVFRIPSPADPARTATVRWSVSNGTLSVDDTGTVTVLPQDTIGAVCDITATVDYADGDSAVFTYRFICNKYSSGLTLPRGLVEIDAEAFEGLKYLEQAELGENVRQVASGAFLGAVRLQTVVVRGKKTKLADDAFERNNDTTFLVLPGSSAEKWAIRNHRRYVYIVK